jgi:drug/metabolite transporter (DMT)-like permease
MTLLPLVGLFHLEQNIPLAIAIVVFSSFLFAGGATIQHLAVDKTVDDEAENRSMNLKQVLSLLQNRVWLGGLAMVATGASLHIVGLALAPVTVVQPVGILAVPWSVLLAAKLHGFRPTKLIWGSVALTIIGIVGFTYFSASSAAKHTVLEPWTIVIAVLIVFAIGSVLGWLGMNGSDARRCLMWASGGSFFYGLSSAMIKTLFELFGKDRFWTMPLFYAVVVFLLICYMVGGWMIQQGYANGPAEIVVGSMTTTDPIIAVGFGIIVLGEGALLTGLDGIGMVISGAVAISGVVILSKYHPDAQARRTKNQPAESVAEPTP